MRFLSDILAKSGLIVDGTVKINTIAGAATDTDKFIVSDNGFIKFRTGAQVLSDIGGQPSGVYVTSVAASITGNSLAITGSPITTSGTLAFAFGGTNLQYIDGAGNLTTFPTGLPPTGTAGGDLTGTYPNPTVHRVHGEDFQSGTPSTNDVWVYGGPPNKWQHQQLNTNQLVNGANFITLASLSATAPLVYSSGAFSITQASASVNGFLSSTDWTTFNNKQNALTNPVTGTGTTNFLPKFTGASAIGNSIVQDSGSGVSIGVSPTSCKFQVYQSATTGVQAFIAAHINGNQIQVAASYNYYDAYNHIFRSLAGTTTYATIDNSGNLGLGVTPTSGYGVLQINASTLYTTIASLIKLSTGANSYANRQSVFEFGQGGTNPNGYSHQISASTSAAASDNTLNFALCNGGETTRVNVLTLLGTGNVGIGNTAADGFKLDVSGTGRFTGQTTFGNTLQVTGNANVPASGAGLELAASTSATGITSFNRSLGTYLASGFNALSFSFAISGVEKFAIATSTGAATFSSSVTATIFDSTSNAFRFSGSNALSLVSLGGQSVVKINAAGYFGTQLVGANDQGILVNNVGNVGIGTTSPAYKLDVNGAARASSFIPNGSSVPTVGMYSSAANTLDFATNTTNRFSISSAGAATFTGNLTTGDQILIGTSPTINGAINFIKTNASPVASRITFGTDGTGYKFAIAKNVSSTITDLFTIQDNGATTFSSSVTASSFIPNGSSVPTLGMYSSAANTLDFATNSGNKLSINSNGDAGFTANVYAVGFIGNLETSTNIRFNQTLSTSSSGASGSFLTINVNGTLYKLNLLNT